MKILICIAFYENQERYKYLYSVLSNLSTYKNASIVVHTNNNKAKKNIENNFPHVKSHVCHNLETPLHLTWEHRKYISNKIDEYDVFMYTEDDILLPLECFQNYIVNFEMLWPDYIPSFIRIEVEKGIFYNSDAVKKTSTKEIIKIQNKNFICLDNPYHGFWIFPSFVIKDNIEDFLNVTKEKRFIREIAASYGLASGSKGYANWKPSKMNKKGLVQIDKLKVSELCYSYHLPNNYINSNDKYGKIKVKNLIDRTIFL